MVPATLELPQQLPPHREVHGVSGNPPPPDAAPPSWGATTGGDVLARLRDRSTPRPRIDPELAGGLRAWLEDGATALAAARGDDAAPLYLGPRRLFGDAHPAPAPGATGPYPAQLVISCLVHALFRQLVTIGSVGDPLGDALDALRIHPHRTGLVHHVISLDSRSTALLSAEVTRQLGHLRALVPHFAPGWLPRTDDRLAIPLAGGRVVLYGVFDLLVGTSVPGRASVCAVQLISGGPGAFARATSHYLALLETLRNGSPPFRLALLDSGVGCHVIEDVREEHLRAMVSHVVTRLSTLDAGLA